MKKYVLDLQVSAVEHPNSKYTLIKLTDALEDLEDVQNVYSNEDLDDSLLD